MEMTRQKDPARDYLTMGKNRDPSRVLFTLAILPIKMNWIRLDLEIILNESQFLHLEETDIVASVSSI